MAQNGGTAAGVDDARKALLAMNQPGVVTDFDQSVVAAQAVTSKRWMHFAETSVVYPKSYPPPPAGDGSDVFKAADEGGEGKCTRKEIAKYLMRNQTLRHRLREGWQKFNSNFGTEDCAENHEEIDQAQFCALWAEAAAMRKEPGSPRSASPRKGASPKAGSPSPASPSPVTPKEWGAWGQAAEEGALAPEGEEFGQGEDSKKPDDSTKQHALLDDLKVEHIDHSEERTIIKGPDGYEYPPLTEAGIEVLQRWWSGELPKNREQSVIAWEKRLRAAKQLGLPTIPVPPKIPAKEVLMRAVAQKASHHPTDLSHWAVPDEPEEELSAEMKEFNEKGLVPETVTRMLQEREDCRLARDFPKADAIRDQLFQMGVEINDQLKQWRHSDGHSGSWGSGMPPGAGPQGGLGGPVQQGGGGGSTPIELQDIDLPGSWEEFLQLPEPKVIAVGPRQQATGKRAWGCGGSNWGTNDEQQAVEQALQNCRNQGVYNPKVIWPPHLAGPPQRGGKGGKGGFGDDRGYGKGGGGKGKGGYAQQGGKGGYGGDRGADMGPGRKGGYGGDMGGAYGGQQMPMQQQMPAPMAQRAPPMAAGYPQQQQQGYGGGYGGGY